MRKIFNDIKLMNLLNQNDVEEQQFYKMHCNQGCRREVLDPACKIHSDIKI